MNLYRYIPVWSRLPEGLALYRCIELVGQGFVVQSKDYFYAHHSVQEEQERMAQLDHQFLQLLYEEAPERRCPLSTTLQEAIATFEANFDK